MQAKDKGTRVKLIGFAHGHLMGRAYLPYPNILAYGYHVSSDCGKVAFTANASKARHRIEEAQANNQIPEFYYD
jgi:hypothetical protein